MLSIFTSVIVNIVGDGTTTVFTVPISDLCASVNTINVAPISAVQVLASGTQFGVVTASLNNKGTDITITFGIAPSTTPQGDQLILALIR